MLSKLAEPAVASPSHPGLELAFRLLQCSPGDQPGLPVLLARIAAAYDAPASGICSQSDGNILLAYPSEHTAKSWPWQDDPSLLAHSRRLPGAVAAHGIYGHLLFTTFQAANGCNWILWVERPESHPFDEGDAAALAFIGHALTRWQNEEAGPHWAEQLELAANQERFEIASTVTRRLAHDFGNVLTGILGFTELAIAQQVPATTPLHTYLQEVYRAAQGGAMLTHQLRLFSRRQSTSSRSCAIGPLLVEQEARLFAAQPVGLEFRLEVPADLPSVSLDSDSLHQVLTTLLDNAREALMGPGTISISARAVDLTPTNCRDLYGSTRPGPHVEVIIADTGIGLSSEARKRLFVEPFYTSKPRRRGFGLAVAYGILHAHRGGIRLHAGEERGVVARVLLPAVPTPVAVLPPVSPSERARGERVLIVDDDPNVRDMLASALERAGFRIQTVGDAESALLAYFAHPADPFRLVLTDVVMPGTGGVELTRRLLQRDPGVRVLFMSGHVTAESPPSDLASHAFEMLAKPFSPEQVARAVRAAIDRPARTRKSSPGAQQRSGRRDSAPGVVSTWSTK